MFFTVFCYFAYKQRHSRAASVTKIEISLHMSRMQLERYQYPHMLLHEYVTGSRPEGRSMKTGSTVTLVNTTISAKDRNQWKNLERCTQLGLPAYEDSIVVTEALSQVQSRVTKCPDTYDVIS